MASDQRSKTRAAHHAATTLDDEATWADLEVSVPTDRDHESVVALVECALVELTHEAVGAVFVAHQVGRSTRTQYVARDDVNWRFDRHPNTHSPTIHFHPPPEAATTAAKPSCIDVTEVSLVTRAVYAMWRAAYENDDLDQLNSASNPP